MAAILTACAILGLQTISDSPPRLDGLRYFSLAHNVVTDGIYSYRMPVEGPPTSDNRLEPLYSATLMPGVALASRVSGEDLDCFLEGSPACATWIKWLKLPNIVFYLLLVAAVAWVARKRTNSEPLALVAASIVGFLYLFQTYLNQFFTDILAALLVTVLAGTLLTALQEPQRRRTFIILSGLCLGALSLTKSAYLYAIPVTAAALAAALAIERRERAPTDRALRTVAIFLAASIVLPGAWIVRNQISIDDASWIQLRGGSTGVLTLRTEFGLMTAEEYRAAWVYWSTPTTGPELASDHLDPASYHRLVRGNDDGFYQTNKRSDGRVERNDSSGALRLYLSELPKQAALTPLIAWRGTVPWAQFGIPDGPSWEPRLRMIQEHFYRLLLPAFLWQSAVALRRRDGQMLLFLAPMAASIGFHATLTHYLPRYSVPIAPLGAILIVMSLAPLLAGRTQLFRRLRPRVAPAVKESTS